MDECVTALMKELVRFQDRLYQKDPMKARMKRRIVMGLREVLKHLKLRKIKCVVISPNCERIQSKGAPHPHQHHSTAQQNDFTPCHNANNKLPLHNEVKHFHVFTLDIGFSNGQLKTLTLRFMVSGCVCAGGLDEALYTIINTCRQQEVPFVFALSRKALGRCVNKVVPVSLVGIFNYDGAQVRNRHVSMA